MATSKKTSTSTDAVAELRAILAVMHAEGVTQLHMQRGDLTVSLTVPVPRATIPLPLVEDADEQKEEPAWKRNGRMLDRELFGEDD